MLREGLLAEGGAERLTLLSLLIGEIERARSSKLRSLWALSSSRVVRGTKATETSQSRDLRSLRRKQIGLTCVLGTEGSAAATDRGFPINVRAERQRLLLRGAADGGSSATEEASLRGGRGNWLTGLRVL